MCYQQQTIGGKSRNGESLFVAYAKNSNLRSKAHSHLQLLKNSNLSIAAKHTSVSRVLSLEFHKPKVLFGPNTHEFLVLSLEFMNLKFPSALVERIWNSKTCSLSSSQTEQQTDERKTLFCNRFNGTKTNFLI
jgi:hypothetical protein